MKLPGSFGSFRLFLPFRFKQKNWWLPCVHSSRNVYYSYFQNTPLKFKLLRMSLSLLKGESVGILEELAVKIHPHSDFNALLFPAQGSFSLTVIKSKKKVPSWGIRKKIGLVFNILNIKFLKKRFLTRLLSDLEITVWVVKS